VKLNILEKFSEKKIQAWNFMKISALGAEFNADGRMDGQTWRSQQSFFAVLQTRLNTSRFVDSVVSGSGVEINLACQAQMSVLMALYTVS
jgi:hypothetical protein